MKQNLAYKLICIWICLNLQRQATGQGIKPVKDVHWMQMPAFSGLKYTYLGYCKMKPDQGKGILNNTYDDIWYFDKNDKKHYKIRKNYMR